MANALLDPPPPANMVTSTGGISQAAYSWFQSLKQNLSGAIAGLSTVQGQQEVLEFAIASPQNQDYPWEINAPYGYTITQVDSFCASGTCTATVKIGTTALGGTANAVSGTLQSQPQTSANVVAAGNTTKVTISASSACKLLRLVMWITRT